MSNFIDEQSEEIEVLQSIFPSEFESISADSFKIRLSPGDDEVHVAVRLVVEFPPAYPSVVPLITIEPEKGLGKRQIEEIQALGQKIIEENVGMPTIFMVAEGVKDWLTDNNKPGQDGSMYAEMMRRMQQKDQVEKKKADKAAISAAADSELKADMIDPEEQERIRKRQAGTQVTLESFNEWKIKFDAEMKALAEQNKKVVISELEDRPTGKQLFLLNKVKDDDEEALVMAGEEEDLSNLLLKKQGDGVDDNIEIEDEDDEDDEDYKPGEEGDELGDDDDDDDYDDDDS